jgi:crotonobetainyl-CoA:carnitine CoA-transferase CaiB-like acyl-CoA transferase
MGDRIGGQATGSLPKGYAMVSDGEGASAQRLDPATRGARPGPLSSLRVLELGHIVAGPSAGLILADLGADVIRVEDPAGRDAFRTTNAGMFTYLNRNKRSVAIDLKAAAGKAAYLDLVARSDVVIDNFAPGVVERLGVSYRQLREINPEITYLGLRGFLEGPYGTRPLLDELAQMMGGLAYMTGPRGRPLRAGAPVVDMGAAAYGVIGVLAALFQRQRTGYGQDIRAGLFETVVYWSGPHMAESAASGEPQIPFPERTQADRATWGIYDLFETSDARQIFIGVTSDAQWRRFCHALDLSDLADDARLTTNKLRTAARPWVVPRISGQIAAYSAAELHERLSAAGVPFAPVNRPDELSGDIHLNASGQLLESPMPGGAPAKLPKPPFTSGDYRLTLYRPAPGLGEHTREVLLEIGCREQDLRDMEAAGTIRLGRPLAPEQS